MVFFGAGIAFSSLHQVIIQPRGMPDLPVIARAVLIGTVSSIPKKSKNKTEFIFDLESIDGHKARTKIKLIWYQNVPQLKLGQQWSLSVKLKKPRNFNNPGGFDYVSSLARHHICWTGYVRSQNNVLLNSSPSYDWLALRQYLGDKLSAISPDSDTSGIIEALTLNLTRYINTEHWELFRRTGTIHLFGISGEHLAFLFGMSTYLIRKLWSCSSTACTFLPSMYVASCVSSVLILIYSFLAGFEPPVQRALVGCILYTLYSMGVRKFTMWQNWRYALFIVLCIEPHAVFMQGFYFSFLAVACIFITQQRWRVTGLKNALCIQLSCLVGLMPLTLYWYGYGSINGYLANLVAIPLVGFLIMPLALLTLVLSISTPYAPFLMSILVLLVKVLLLFLHWTERFAWINLNILLTSIETTCTIMGLLLLLVILPTSSYRFIALTWFLFVMFPARLDVKKEDVLIDVLDVGQGLSIAIKTKNHFLLYDTGDKFYNGGDIGKMVVLPYLKNMGINVIDAIVISHSDQDHRGGLDSIESSIRVKQLIVNDLKYYTHGINCHSVPKWQWDGVTFRFFAIKKNFKNKNNNSCVLQVSTATRKILFPGDIEQKAERYLITTYHSELSSDVLILAHHGSKTSSSSAFLEQVNPQFAIASLGFDNRFHFPHSNTLNNLDKYAIPMYRTDLNGMIRLKLEHNKDLKNLIFTTT